MKQVRVVQAGSVPYQTASRWQKTLHGSRVAGEIPDLLLMLEHPHVYTLGRRFKVEHLLLSDKLLRERGIEVHEADRGGSITYHGPGQLVCYPILDLRQEGQEQPDAIRYLRVLEEAIIRTVRHWGIAAIRREGLTGVWVGERKLASIGVNVSRGVTKHGLAVNVNSDLSYFEGMVPCGIEGVKVTSMNDLLQAEVEVAEFSTQLVRSFCHLFHRMPVEMSLEEMKRSMPPEEDPGAQVIHLPKASGAGL